MRGESGHYVGNGHSSRLLGYDHQGVACHDEVVVLRVVVGGIEGDAVKLLLRQVPGIRGDGATVITRCQEK